MVGIEGVYIEPVRANKPAVATPPERGNNPPVVALRDGLSISQAAQEVQQVARLMAKPDEEESAYRVERIEEIKKSLEEGIYQIQEVVAVVAARISKYVTLE